MLSKTDMEKVWQSKELFKLKEYNKKNKGAKVFKVECTPVFRKILKDQAVIIDVVAKRSSDATYVASVDARSKFKEKGLEFSEVNLRII